MTASEETAIRAWLAHIGEADAETVDHIVRRCRDDPAARRYFTERAAAECPAPEPDDRRHCHQCRNLAGNGCCLAAESGELPTGRNYRPIDWPPRRCAAFNPTPNESDQRPGRDRWPSLLIPLEASES